MRGETMLPWSREARQIRRARLEYEKARLLRLMAENDRRLAELKREAECDFCFPAAK